MVDQKVLDSIFLGPFGRVSSIFVFVLGLLPFAFLWLVAQATLQGFGRSLGRKTGLEVWGEKGVLKLEVWKYLILDGAIVIEMG